MKRRRAARGRAAATLCGAAACVIASFGQVVQAQSLEPRAYSNVPIGVSFLIVGASESRGGVAFDTALPLSDPDLTVRNGTLGYATAFELWGSAAKFDVAVPYGWLSGSATYHGAVNRREVDGVGDPVLRVTWNFHGAPALTAREFAAYRQDLIVGASLQVSVPVGQYDPSKLVNLGTNRWFFKPEIGASKALGPWILEAKGSVTFYTTNDDFFGGNRRAQDPLHALQGSVIRELGGGKWMSADATVFGGGRTTLNDVANRDRQQNWRAGLTFALPIDAQRSLKFFVSRGVSARTGNSFDLFGVAWQYRWSGSG